MHIEQKDIVGHTTPLGSHIMFKDVHYKHIIPLGLKQIKYKENLDFMRKFEIDFKNEYLFDFDENE